MAMGWIAVGTAALSAYESNQASNRAADATNQAAKTSAQAQLEARRLATQEQRREFDINQQNQQPYMQAGQTAVNYLNNNLYGGPQTFTPGDYTQSPGYQWQLQQGTQGIQNYLGANKMRLSGAALKELSKYQEGAAAQDYGNWWNRQMGAFQANQAANQNYLGNIGSIASLGENAAAGVGNAGANMANANSATYANTANALSNIYTNQGANQANIATGNAANQMNAVNSGISNYLAYRQNQNMMNLYNNGYNQYGYNQNGMNYNGTAYGP